MFDLDSVADDLYGLDPGDFVAARAEYAARARKAGDRELTAAIGRLRKPTVAAWLVNLLARERAEELAALFDIGSALRTAQRRLSGGDLRTLSAQRRRVVAALEADARKLATARGRTVSDTALTEVSRTLNAALADAEVGERVRRGCLETIAEADGFGDLSAVPLTVVPNRDDDTDTAPDTGTATDTDTATDTAVAADEDVAAEAERRDRIAAAESQLESARRAAEEAREAAGTAERELADHESEVAELKRRLEHAEQKRTFARRAAGEAKKRVVAADRAVAAAEAHVARAKS